MITRVHPRCRAPRWSDSTTPDGHRGKPSQPARDAGHVEGNTPTGSSSEASQRQTISVLVIEDDPGVRESTADLLRDSGYDVLEAADGIEGLRQLRERSFDVVILDLRLPRLDGPELLDAVKAPPPVVIVSALEYFEEVEVRQRFESKVFAVLRKPVSPERLLAVVAEAVRGSRGPGIHT